MSVQSATHERLTRFVLSVSRPDVLPPSVMTELSKLQDNMPTFPTTDARATVERELGQPIDVVFSEFGACPVAAASLAQVYRARLRSDGREVAVKVQRPGALATISKVSSPLFTCRGSRCDSSSLWLFSLFF